jgi:hypothetical protein
MGSWKVAFLVCFDRCPTTFDMRLYIFSTSSQAHIRTRPSNPSMWQKIIVPKTVCNVQKQDNFF